MLFILLTYYRKATEIVQIQVQLGGKMTVGTQGAAGQGGKLIRVQETALPIDELCLLLETCSLLRADVGTRPQRQLPRL